MINDVNEVIKTIVLNGDCENPLCEGYVVRHHEISEEDFEKMKTDFYGSGNTKKELAVQIDLNGKDCTFHLEFSYADNQNDNNISVSFKQGIATQPLPGIISASYSLTLFKGIVAIFAPDEFLASKATDANGKKTAVIKVVKNNLPVYYCDLSHDIPLFPGIYL